MSAKFRLRQKVATGVGLFFFGIRDIILCRSFRPQFSWDQLFPGLTAWASLFRSFGAKLMKLLLVRF